MAKRVRSINLEEETWSRLEVEAKRRGISVSSLVSTIVNDTLNPKDGVPIQVFETLSKMATLGLAPWKQERKPSL